MNKAISALTLAATVLTAGLAHAKDAAKPAAKPEAKHAAAPAPKHAEAKHPKQAAHKKAVAKLAPEKKVLAPKPAPEKK